MCTFALCSLLLKIVVITYYQDVTLLKLFIFVFFTYSHICGIKLDLNLNTDLASIQIENHILHLFIFKLAVQLAIK